VFSRSTRVNLILSALFILGMGACGTAGGCGACSAVQPLPGGKLPADQTVEGGAQIRVTQQGFSKLTSILPGLLNQQLGAGFCVPGGSVALGLVDYCQTTQGQCRSACRIVPTLNAVTLSVTGAAQQVLHAHVDARATAAIPLSAFVGSCTVDVTVDHLIADVDVVFGVDGPTGELTIHANAINQFSFNGHHFNGCGIISDLASVVVDILNTAIGQFVIGLLTPVIDNLIQGFLPHPLGLEGMMNVGNLLEGLSPGTEALMEARIVPGGYVSLRGNGLSLGMITGLNADRNPATRTAALASEPALCVPPLAKPAFGAAPANLPATSRSTFLLGAANELNGVPSDPATDIAMGLSETMLDLAGHHLVTSGALCLGVGTSFIKQLNVGTIGLLVRSLGGLASDEGNDPLLLVTRPQQALDFTIGNNTVASPALTVGIKHMEVDFYAFLYERYVRAFTLDLTMDVGVNLEFDQPAGQPAKIRPTLVGISADKVTIKVLNSEFVKETPAELEAVLPSVFSLVTPLLGSLPEITVPSFAGFQLGNLSIQHVTSSQDDFLALYASLAPSSLMLQAASGDPLMSSAVHTMAAAIPAPQAPSTGRARLASVTTPTTDRVRGALLHDAGGALPRVTFDVDHFDASGRELEWAYQLDHGMWRPWQSAAPLVIEDQAFAWQGKYTIGLQSRVKGDYHTASEPSEFPVIIDSVSPRIVADKAAWKGDTYAIPAFDIVSGRALAYAFGRPGRPAPESAWVQGGTIELSRDDAQGYAGDDGKVAVFVKDEAGNTAIALIAPFHGQSDNSGCTCATHQTPGAGGLALVVIVGGVLLGRRRSPGLVARLGRLARVVRLRHHRAVRRAAVTGVLWAGGSLAMSLSSGCNCSGKAQAESCELVSDCSADFCDPGQLPYCLDNTCVCSDDIPTGRVGPYSDVAVGPAGGIWVSAYAQSHGDLVVAQTTGGRIPDEAWEWVDGVPDGPVIVPDSKIRRGIDEDGPDVGMYTSIAVGPDGAPMVSYFDRDTASLKFAQKVNGTWQTHVVDQGTGQLAAAGALVGMYTSLTLRSDDGRPGIAYLAHVKDAAGSRAEVRFASAQTPRPGSAGDWQTWVVDAAPLPPADPANPAVYPLPEGLGLFIDSARMANQAPVVAYYDRSKGDLKVARFNVQSGQFAAARVLDGSSGVDAGWSPSIAVDASGVAHVAYVGATADDLKYLTDTATPVPEVIDDGYRIVGQTAGGLPKPEFHFVGEDASIVLPPGGGPLVVYQDSTTQELLLAQKQADGKWTHVSIAGGTDPWPGGYGFFAASTLAKDQLVMSTWVVNLPASDFKDSNWVEVFSRPIAP
jgi:MYXO-CTERM domain-containing protein